MPRRSLHRASRRGAGVRDAEQTPRARQPEAGRNVTIAGDRGSRCGSRDRGGPLGAKKLLISLPKNMADLLAATQQHQQRPPKEFRAENCRNTPTPKTTTPPRVPPRSTVTK